MKSNIKKGYEEYFTRVYRFWTYEGLKIFSGNKK